MFPFFCYLLGTKKRAWFVVIVVYITIVYNLRKLPKCPAGKKGVLFVFKTATKDHYEEIKHSIQGHFSGFAISNISDAEPICIDVSCLKHYNRNDKVYMKDLLQKTNCIFCIDLFVETDQIQNPKKYFININSGVLHPNIKGEYINTFFSSFFYT